MRFSELLRQTGLAPCHLRGDAEITAVSADSRRCERGSCFVAVSGPVDDGHKYIPSAVAAGASAIVCQDASMIADSAVCALVKDASLALGPLAQAIRGWPARRLVSIGITGTKGKSTTAYLVRSVLEQANLSAGLIGTICYDVGKKSMPAGNTTPGPVEIAELTGQMVANGATHLVMEVSSHALDQNRTAGIGFQVGVFTNLSGDHMDYHKTMDDYRSAKARLFRQLPPDGFAVINADDAAGERIADASCGKVIRYGLDNACELTGAIEKIDAGGTRFAMAWQGKSMRVSTPLIGRHNVYNCLSAAGAALAIGIDLQTTAAGLEKLRSVPGRMQPVEVDAEFRVFVDYAHSDDAMEKAIGSLRPLLAGRIIVVFGCGGDRDRTKRPRMARVAAALSDVVVVTSDNPRTEDPNAIIEQILAGLDAPGLAKTIVEPDRRAAIGLAIRQARAGDIVLIAGKGHENYQILGSEKIHFDDIEEARSAMSSTEEIK